MRLFYFLALSVALHLALLAAWPLAVPPADSGGKTLRVALQGPSPAPGQEVQPSPPAPAQGTRPVFRPAPHVPSPSTAARPGHPPRLHVAAVSSPHAAPAQADPRKVRFPRDVFGMPDEQAYAGEVTDSHPQPPQTPSVKTAAYSAREARPHPGGPRPYESREPATNNSQTPAETSRLASAASPSGADAAPRSLAAVTSQVMSRLFQRLHAHFRYPLVARMRGWEGTVKLGLRVEADGTLSHLRVIGTSGYSVLDRNSLRTVKAITRLSGAAGSLHGRHLDLVLPVKYRLTRGG